MLIIDKLIRAEFVDLQFHFSFTTVVIVITAINSLFQQAKPRASETDFVTPVNFVFINKSIASSRQFITSAGESVHTM